MGNGRTIALVDPYGAVNKLAAAFTEAGLECVRVQSTPQPPPSYGEADLSGYTDNIVHDRDFDHLVARLAALRPVAVVVGSEVGVEFTDRLNEVLGLPGNGTALSEARRDKFVQVETLRAAGLPTTRQLRVTDPDQLADWHRQMGGRIVVKPVRSARNDGVAFCDTPEQSQAAYHHIMSRDSVFDVPNEGVVAQEYLRGVEFVVNTVSCQGRHRITDTWRYQKITVNGILDRINGMTSTSPTDPDWESVAEYSYQVLDALGIQYGPVHLEVMLTADGPRLVEAGARLCGADVARYAVLLTGESQIDRTAQAYADPDRFIAEHRKPYALDNHGAMAFFASPVEGLLRGYPHVHLIEELASCQGVTLRFKVGERLVRTVDDESEPVTVGLIHPDRSVVLQDFATVCYLDGFGFYDIDPGQ
ncbi:ATP-grasp domain-containing protein [Micromonospora sp. WMMD1082]|uniref:ATP-grasp domain-containing protein n=1 Tax=Micromonospora sp. WMMD1082 TaxID=3016104 RepID=UPI002415F880|nr:ATP-grasp domain-containing protein [Micromonospora sp. WMMD1082]MDG4795547.1 ATP-grasp domain-containing protein [Micromonospora sp. WMMD1082]